MCELASSKLDFLGRSLGLNMVQPRQQKAMHFWNSRNRQEKIGSVLARFDRILQVISAPLRWLYTTFYGIVKEEPIVSSRPVLDTERTLL